MSDHDPRWTVDEDWADHVRHFIAVRDERAPTDIDIERGTNDAPWWLALREAFDGVEDVGRRAVRDAAEVQGLRDQLAHANSELDRIRPLIGQHDSTGADHMEDAARLATENDGLRDQLAAAQAVIREALDTASTRGMAMEDKYDAVLSILHDAADAIAQAQGHQP